MAARFLILFTVLTLAGCEEDDSLALFINDMSDYVEVQIPASAVLNDPCLLANGRAAAKWYADLPAKHREALKQNVQRYVHAVRFVKTEIVSGVPVTMARTTVNYDRGTILVTTKGVLDSSQRVVCDPDIDVLLDFTVARNH